MLPHFTRPWGGLLSFLLLAVTLLLIFSPLSASAHHLPPELEEVDEFADAAFQAGLRHPWQGLDHWLLAAVAGLLGAAAVRQRDRIWTGLVFVGSMTLGGCLPVWPLPAWLMPLLAGGLLVAHFQLPRRWLLLCLALSAGLQAQLHLAEWPWEAVRTSYGLGVLLSSTALFTVTALVARIARWQLVPTRPPAIA